MTKNSKKKPNKEKESIKIDNTANDNNSANDNWLVLAMLAHNLLGEVVQAIEKGDLIIPAKSTFNLEDFKNKVGFIEAVAEKTFNEQKDKLNESDKEDKKLN